MSDELKFFERFLFEAPEDGPPDENMGTGDTTDAGAPPDLPDAGSEEMQPPPDLDVGDEPADDGSGEATGDMGPPPDMDGGFGGDEQMDDQAPEEDPEQDQGNQMEFDTKISAVMNQTLYQKFLALLNNIESQLTTIKQNSDVLYSISNDSLDVTEKLKKLEENIRLYLNDNFMNENYSKNLLFFNKCLNLLKLLNDVFDKNIRKGIKDIG